MKALKRTRYYTMNSWNRSTAPAYNLKIYNVIGRDLQGKVYELMDADGFYDGINAMIANFDYDHGHEWQAGFNGHSGGYLVLYRGGRVFGWLAADWRLAGVCLCFGVIGGQK